MSLSPVAKAIRYIKKHRVACLLIAILVIGAIFKLSHFSELVRFNADQVRDTRIVEGMIEENEFPLLGPKAGGTTFKLGPAFYYLEYVSALFFGHTPEGIALIFPLLSLASIGLFFLFFRRFFSVSLTLGLTTLYTTAFYFTKYSRFAWNPNAIPFFLLAFLLLLLTIRKAKEERLLISYGLLGIVMGIGTQLHTTLLLLMPILFLAVHIRIVLREKHYRFKELFLTLGIVLALYFPFFLSDFQNDGANIRSFFVGTMTKTEENQSIGKNLSLNAQFFIQGATYALSGMEPDKDWTARRTYTSLPSNKELALLFSGLTFFILGLFFLVRRIRKERLSEKRDFLELVTAMAALSFVLFLPIANELNLRFFIVLLVLPYLFLGLLTEQALGWLKIHHWLTRGTIGIIFSLLVLLNTWTVLRTYNLDNYQVKDQAYGGISVGEGRRLAAFIANQETKSGETERNIPLYPFEFERSLDYFLELADWHLQSIEEDQLRKEVRYLITENAKMEERLKELSCCYTVSEREQIGRFTIAALFPKEDANGCKIGFITDVHATRSKETPYIGLGSYVPLQAFMDHMQKNFQPDLLIEDGDFIDGSETTNARALEVYQRAEKIYAGLGIPALHVMGNHETRGGGITTAQWLKLTGQKNTYYAKTCKNTEVIVLDGNNDALRDSMSEDQREAFENSYFIDETQFTWLEKTLEEAKDRQKIVFIHEPFFPRAAITSNIKPEKDLRPEDVKRLNTLFQKYSVAAVVSGHVESLFYKRVNGTANYILPGVRKSADLPVQWLGSFAEISVESSGETGMNFFYKKGVEEPYQSVIIPSQKFDALEK